MAMQRNNRSDEGGFVLLWTLFVVLPLTFVGFVFLMYGQMNVRKLEAQFQAMNLVVAGTRNSEFDSEETLNSMAAFAHASGFTNAVPSEAWQSFPKGELAFVHEAGSGENTVTSYIVFEQGVVSNLISTLTGIDVAGVSRAKPGRLLITLILDYSQSLHNDFDRSDILEAIDVHDSSGAVDYHGTLDGGNRVVPDDAAQLALPYGINPWNRIRRPWLRQSAAWGWAVSNNVSCVVTEENPCSGSEGSHSGNIAWHHSNQFFAYKNAAAILLGVVAQTSPYLDVELLGGVLGQGAKDRADFWMVGTAPGNNSPYTQFENDGSFEIWRYDEPEAEGYVPSLATNPIIQMTIKESHTDINNPKDVFEENALMDWRRPTADYLVTTQARKIFRYATVTGAGSGKVINPGQYSAFFDPPLPVLNRPGYVPPVDAFSWYPGDIVGTEDTLAGELFPHFGWPWRPIPEFAINGFAHPDPSDMHTPIGDGYIYGCDPNDYVAGMSGPPLTHNVPLSHDPSDSGYWVCLIRDYCDNLRKDNSAGCVVAPSSTPAPTAACPDPPSTYPAYSNANEVNVYFDTTRAYSPRCSSAGLVPKCTGGTCDYAPYKKDSAVMCNFGDPSSNMVARCSNGGSPRCYNPSTGTFDMGEIPLCEPGGIPNGHGNCNGGAPCQSAAQGGALGIPAVSLGSISFPANPPRVGNSLFFYLIDMGLLPPGTMTHNSVPNNRCAEFKNKTDGLGECGYVLVTDGRPLGTTHAGAVLIDDTTIMSEMDTRMDLFTEVLGGKSFVWFLGRWDRWQSVVSQVSNFSSLTPAQQAAFNDVQNSQLICPSAAWDSINGPPDCPEIDDITSQHVEGTTALTNFRNIMDDPSKDRFWTDTSLENMPTGPSINGSLATFLGGLKNIIALLKREPEFDK